MFIFFCQLSIIFLRRLVRINKDNTRQEEEKHKYNTDNFIRWITDGEIKKKEKDIEI